MNSDKKGITELGHTSGFRLKRLLKSWKKGCLRSGS